MWMFIAAKTNMESPCKETNACRQLEGHWFLPWMSTMVSLILSLNRVNKPLYHFFPNNKVTVKWWQSHLISMTTELMKENSCTSCPQQQKELMTHIRIPPWPSVDFVWYRIELRSIPKISIYFKRINHDPL